MLTKLNQPEKSHSTRTRDGGWTPGDAIYVTGDTVWYEGVAEVARRFRPRLVILFAGAAKTRGSFHLTMDSNDAIEAAHALPDAQIIAVHTEGWTHFTESRDDLARAFVTLGLGERLRSLEAGKATMLDLRPFPATRSIGGRP